MSPEGGGTDDDGAGADRSAETDQSASADQPARGDGPHGTDGPRIADGSRDADQPASANGPIGKRRWVVPGGHVPTDSTGPEPEMVSHDVLCVLNAGGEMATFEVALYYADDVVPGGNVAGPYPLTVAPRRVRHVRVNDLIDPYAPPLGEEYAAVVESDGPVVVQFSRLDSRQDENATLSTVAYGEE